MGPALEVKFQSQLCISSTSSLASRDTVTLALSENVLLPRDAWPQTLLFNRVQRDAAGIVARAWCSAVTLGPRHHPACTVI